MSKVARLFLRSAAFRCDGRKNRGPTKQVAPQVGEHSTWSCTSLTVEVLPLSPPKSASHKRGGIWLRAEFLRGPFSLSCNDQVEVPILRAAEESKLRLPLHCTDWLPAHRFAAHRASLCARPPILARTRHPFWCTE